MSKKALDMTFEWHRISYYTSSLRISYYEIANAFHMKYINKSYMIAYTCGIIYDFIYI